MTSTRAVRGHYTLEVVPERGGTYCAVVIDRHTPIVSSGWPSVIEAELRAEAIYAELKQQRAPLWKRLLGH